MRWIIVGVIILFLILLSVYRITRKRQVPVHNNKVIHLSAHSKKREQARKQQKCSFCRKENKKLAFYSDENGKIVGVCPVCKPLAERRALMRL
ncbi:hypothetical protein [Paenibacillus aestuarii]|uniref:HNH endonuclease n=1 Tax=Paenibacillus aestuarii TaxID=516965 RepID=A0ABW0K9U2_9BACL|nr:hypothetical protein [Paenibacillus aestuarii]